jgi:glycogen operon protein
VAASLAALTQTTTSETEALSAPLIAEPGKTTKVGTRKKESAK